MPGGFVGAEEREAVFRQSVDPVIEKAREEATFIEGLIPLGKEEINMRGVDLNLEIEPNPSWGFFSRGGALPAISNNLYLTMKVLPSRCAQGYGFDGDALQEAEQKNNLAGSIMEQCGKYFETAHKKSEQAMLGTRTARLGVVLTRDSATQVTFAKTFAAGSLLSSRRIQHRGRYQFVSTAGAVRAQLSTASIPPVPSTGVATFDAVDAAVVATDIAVYENSYNQGFAGLEDQLSDSGIIQGRPRSTYPWLKVLTDNLGGAQITPPRVYKNRNALRFRGEGDVSKLLILSSLAQSEGFLLPAYPLLRFQGGGGKPQQNFDGPSFLNHGWREHVDIQDDTLYGWDVAASRKWPLKPWGRYRDDDMDLRMQFSGSSGQDKYVGWYGWKGAVGFKRYHTSFAMVNCSVAGLATGFASANP